MLTTVLFYVEIFRRKAQSNETQHHKEGSFSSAYTLYLKKTNRLYDDAEVKEFPGTFFYNLHQKEWELRKISSQRLLSYLNRPAKEEEPFRLLEIGCGNGWLSGKIANLTQFEVTGLDIYEPVLNQAKRVFSQKNLSFVQGDVFDNLFPEATFDLVVLFDTISYFPHFQQLINRCRQYLKKDGEIHIMESPFYAEKELESAKAADDEQFAHVGVPEMGAFYYQHSRADLSPFDFQFLYRPGGLSKLLGRKDSPYSWVKIVN